MNAIIDRYLVKRMNESLRELFRPTASAGGEFGIEHNASFFPLDVYIIWPTSAVVTAQLLPTGESPN